MDLYIAEKPSLGKKVAAALNASRRKGGCIEGDGLIVTWCIGHLFEQAEPDQYDERYKSWRYEDLPIIPEKWRLVVKKETKEQFNTVRTLLKSASRVINVGDPDREGQRLVDELLEVCKWKGDTKRLWLPDVTAATIKKQLKAMKPNSDYATLSMSAKARGQADWLLGMNLTRAYTVMAKDKGYPGVLSVGRVQTPTLRLVVDRDRAIESFVALPFYDVTATIAADGTTFCAKWKPVADIADESGRCQSKQEAESVLSSIDGVEGSVISAERVEKSKIAPLPFSLSAIQAYASKKWGYGAQQVLDLAQSLYEAHEATTYPRTDCQYLSSREYDEAQGIVDTLCTNSEFASVRTHLSFDVRPKAFNDSKITAHTAIVPTRKCIDLSTLSPEERNIYLAVARRYLAQFAGQYRYEATALELSISGHTFVSKGNVPLAPGWRSVEAPDDTIGDAESDDDENSELPLLEIGQGVTCTEAKLLQKKTKPPARFTEGSLITAMSGIAKYVDDAAAKKVLRGTEGIGTEATRAGIIETLKRRGFLEEKGKQIISTANAREFIDIIPAEVTDPVTTAKWEGALDDIVSGALTFDKFVSAQEDWVKELVAAAGNVELTITDSRPLCPKCDGGRLNGPIKGSKGKFWACSDRDNCSSTFPDKRGKPDLSPRAEVSGHDCPKCRSHKLRGPIPGKNGKFWGCTDRDNCGATFPDKRGKPDFEPRSTATQVGCPKCKTGKLRGPIPGKNGKFWACSDPDVCGSTFSDRNGKPVLA